MSQRACPADARRRSATRRDSSGCRTGPANLWSSCAAGLNWARGRWARSILAVPVDPRVKDWLNHVKNREDDRPVAPVCLVDQALRIFDPGTPNPHMLFDHRVRPGWLDRVPAIVHLDGTARLQTVADDNDPVLAEVLWV